MPDDSVDPAAAQQAAQQINQANALQQMMQERKKNWSQMTPEEILGVKSADGDNNAKNANGSLESASHSPLESFLMEQHQAQTGTTNLNVSHENWNFLDEATGRANQQRLEQMRNGNIVGSQIFARLLQNAGDDQNDSANNNQDNQDQAWFRVFSAPQPDQPTPQQLAEMTAFQQLLQPSASASDLQNAASAGKSFAQPIPVVDPNLNPLPAGYNPMGGSFIPLQSGVGRPSGIAPPPSVTSALPTPAIIPSWAPKSAPWTQDSPQLFVTPQRKF